MPQAFVEDPQAVLDYIVDWTSWLGADTIASASWTVPAGMTQVSSASTTTSATVWLSGGTLGEKYTIVNHIVTTGGRQDDRSFTILIENR